MGYQSGGTCYSTAMEAYDATFSQEAPKLTPGASTFMSYYNKVGGVWKMYTIRYDGNTPYLVTATDATLAIQPCDEVQLMADGAQIGWLMALPMIAAWGLMMIRRQLN